jgi:methyl farnesoate epoxidase/farnesoate epoxidase
MTDGEVWREQRRFTMQHLKDVGVGKSSLEGMILDEIRDLIMDLKVNTSWSNANIIEFLVQTLKNFCARMLWIPP